MEKIMAHLRLAYLSDQLFADKIFCPPGENFEKRCSITYMHFNSTCKSTAWADDKSE